MGSHSASIHLTVVHRWSASSVSSQIGRWPSGLSKSWRRCCNSENRAWLARSSRRSLDEVGFRFQQASLTTCFLCGCKMRLPDDLNQPAGGDLCVSGDQGHLFAEEVAVDEGGTHDDGVVDVEGGG